MNQVNKQNMPLQILLCTFLVGFASTVPTFCVPPMEHILKEQLSLTHTETSLLFVAPVIMLAAIGIPAGLAADRLGVKKSTLIGLIITAVGAALRGVATDPQSLLAFSFVYGLGAGWILANLPKIVSTYASRERATVVTGIVSSGIPIGMALGVGLTIPVIWPATNTYQGVFLIWSIPVIVATVLWWRVVKEPPKNSEDIAELKTFSKSFRASISYKPILLAAAVFFLHNVFTLTWIGWSPALMMMKGASPSLAGLISSMVLWFYIPAYLLIPRLSYLLGIRKPFIWLPSAILAITSWAALSIGVNGSWFLMGLVGIVNGSRFITILALPVEMVPHRDVGIASGIVISLGFVGGVIGPLIGGNIFDNTQSLNLVLIVLIAVSAATALLATRLPETGPGRRK